MLKKTFTLVLTFVLLFCVDIAKAQDYGSPKNTTLYGGAALPMGDFANATAYVQKAGFAKIGFCGGIEVATSFGNDVISGIGTLSLSLNAYDDVKFGELLRQATGYNVNVSIGNYLSGFALYGIKFEGLISPNVSFYGQFQAGLLISKMPDWMISYNYNSTTTTFDLAFAFAFNVGAGIKISNSLNIGVRYMSSNPEYKGKAGSSSSTYSLPLTTSIVHILFGIMI